MNPNPPLGVLFHWIGGLAAASFYLPFKRVRRWSWETYWLVGGVFSWIIAPPIFASLFVPNVWRIISDTPSSTLIWTICFGLLWGVGGLTFGLTVRYLGLALGYAIALGCCAAFGTLIPPLFNHQLGAIAATNGGRVVLLGVLVCLVGIAISGLAGRSKEAEMSETQKKAAVAEFNFPRGLIIAIVCGIMSACMAFAFAAGQPIADAAARGLAHAGRADVWQNLPILVVVLWGGFLTNFVWCVILHLKNKSAGEYIGEYMENAAAPTAESKTRRIALAPNYLLSAAAGLIWYFQFFFYSMGETKMGQFGFSSWTLHMASIIIFSTLWGVALKEWKGSSARTHKLIAAGLATLIASTVIIGWGNYLTAKESAPKQSAALFPLPRNPGPTDSPAILAINGLIRLST